MEKCWTSKTNEMITIGDSWFSKSAKNWTFIKQNNPTYWGGIESFRIRKTKQENMEPNSI